jgi:predicted  nucleic acid-binding Zn-ribbon protein
MTETLPRLLALQACDRHIQQVIRKLDTLQQSLVILKEEHQGKVQEVQAWQEKIRASEKVRDHLTPQIEDVKDQLREKRCALHRRRAGQQDEMLQEEMTLLEASKAALEEELGAVTAQIVRDLEALSQAEDLAAAHHTHVLSMTSVVLDQCTPVNAELHTAQAERMALTTGISTFLLQEYERICSRRGGVAVVALANETCQGCHMHLPPQMCLELQRHPRLTFCPHCQRMLFVPIATNPPEVESHATANSSYRHPPRQPRQQARTKARTARGAGKVVVPPNPVHV